MTTFEERTKGVLNLREVLPNCNKIADGNVNEGLICLLSKHECYSSKSQYLDCWCLVSAGLCPKKLKFREPNERFDESEIFKEVDEDE